MPTAQATTYEGLKDELTQSLIDVDDSRLRSAWEVAAQAYEGKEHWTGEPLLAHVLGALATLLPYHPDEDTVLSCLLHHVLHCKACTLSELEQQFGPVVRTLVSGVHLFSHVTLRGRRSSVEDLRLMLLTVTDDIRAILILLCDRCYLLSRIGDLPAAEMKRVAKDALFLFAPVAARLGIYNLKHELEARAFPFVYPSDAERIAEQLGTVQTSYGDCLSRTAEKMRQFLASQGVSVHVEARDKQPYSAFRKMGEKNITHIQDLYDLFAIRVIAETEPECYQVLGLLHKIGRPVAHRFKDYIAFPKPNGYQSLHTTLAGLPGMPSESLYVEVQVRTHAMHREAQYGVAAHWMYKERGAAASALERVQLHDVLASQQSLTAGRGKPVLADHIFVLTPRGDVVELPEGATPLDFAFQVHTDLGLSFRASRVNGSIVPLDYQLENGDVVEILRHKTPSPSPQWLQTVRMASSKAKLKKFLYAQRRPELLARGRERVNEELRKRRVSPIDTGLTVLKKYDGKTLSIAEREDLLVKIGQNSERASSLLPHLDVLSGRLKHAGSEQRRVQQKATGGVDVEMEGDASMPLQFARCCKPEEGRKGALVGVINRSGCVMVHKKQCKMVLSANPERKVRVWWGK